ncbi:MAG: hypothetical protein M1431_00020 [Candidatus Thermoplasmatota archaeon]|nr:hypothetical protein [Candidatus Thermoplasmatota archaeon]
MMDQVGEKELGPRLGVSLWIMVAIFFSVIYLAIINFSNVWTPFSIYATLSWSFGMPIIIMSFVGGNQFP